MQVLGPASAAAAAARDGISDIYETPRTWQVSSHGWRSLATAEEAGDWLAIKRTGRVRTTLILLKIYRCPNLIAN